MPSSSSPILRLPLLACLTLAAGPGVLEAAPGAEAPAQQQVFTSNNMVDTWDPIEATYEDRAWETTVCTRVPAIGPNAAWVNPHPAFTFGLNAHPWQPGAGFSAEWINARNTMDSIGPGGHNWTKYSTEVSGTGEFVLNLLADNCSWIYIDGELKGFQDASTQPRTYPVTLSGDHTLEFIIFDGGGLAGGMYRLETNTNTTFPDTDGDGLTDPEEHLHGTNKTDPDTDDDGVNDGDEVEAGTSPLVFDAPADSTPPTIDVQVTGTEVNGWYTSDATVTWAVNDPESPVTAAGCGQVTVSTDTAGTTFVCSATSAGGSSTQSVTIKRDTTAPSIGPVSTNAPALWPPNHKMHEIRVSASASDAGSGGTSCRIDGVSSSEGGNEHEPDVQLTGGMTVHLRAERNGNSTGRVYTIQVSCADAAGNRANGTTAVSVPHDQGKKK